MLDAEREQLPDFVFVNHKVYPARVLHDAIAEAMLARLEALPEGVSPRRAARAIAALKTPEGHRAVMNEALRRVDESGEDVPLAEAIKQARGLPIAAFPKRIDSRSSDR